MKNIRNNRAKLLAASLTLGLVASAAAPYAALAESTEAASTEAGEKTTIIAATSGTPKPYIISNDDGSLSGYDIEVLNAVFDLLPQYDLQYVTTEFTSVLTGVTSGLYQIAVNNLSYNAERAQTFLYSFPYDKVSYVFVQRQGDEPITSLADAGEKGFKTHGSAGNNIANALEKYNQANPDKQIQIEYSEAETAEVLQQLEDGQYDFTIIDKAMFPVYTEEFGLTDLQATPLQAIDEADIAENLYSYFLFAQDNDALRQEVDGAIKTLKENGTLTELAQKYYDSDQAPEDDQYENTIN